MPHPHLVFLSLLLAAGAGAQTIVPPFAGSYTFADLGPPPGVPVTLGGLTIRAAEPGALYVAGAANTPAGAIYRVPLARGAGQHITGFGGPAVRVADAPFVDGGVQFGPGGVLFFTTFPNNEVGQIRPGSQRPDRVIPLTPLGVPPSVGGLTFVPAGYGGSGELKVASYQASRFFNLRLQPDGQGTFAVAGIRAGTSTDGGPEGFFYVPPDSPRFVNFSSMIVSDYRSNEIQVFGLDANGDPLRDTRQRFMTGLTGCEGAAIDPLTGDFLFATYAGGDRVLAVRGFGLPCGAVVRYGQGLAGSGGFTPSLDTVGCFARNERVEVRTEEGLGGAPGVLLTGLAALSLPVFGGTLLVAPSFTVGHALGGRQGQAGAGTHAIPIVLPPDTSLLNTDFFFQSVYVDAGAPQGLAFTGGIKLNVR
jgi:hypothetical protein